LLQVTFVHDETIVHDGFFSNQDCRGLFEFPDDGFKLLLAKTTEYQYKIHVVVCESNQAAGLASLPEMFSAADPLKNAIMLDYRAIACRDDIGNFLCELTEDGTVPKEVSHTHWKGTRGLMLAHEIGHTFGLRHTCKW
jgi:hypothetical protein